MILPPFATPKDFTSATHPLVNEKICWLIFSGDQLLIGHDKKTFPTSHEYHLKRTFYLVDVELTGFSVLQFAYKSSSRL